MTCRSHPKKAFESFLVFRRQVCPHCGGWPSIYWCPCFVGDLAADWRVCLVVGVLGCSRLAGESGRSGAHLDMAVGPADVSWITELSDLVDLNGRRPGTAQTTISRLNSEPDGGWWNLWSLNRPGFCRDFGGTPHPL